MTRLPARATGRLALMAILCALAIALSWADSLISSVIPLPGFRLGLANIVVLFALYAFGLPQAAVITLVKSVAMGFVTGGLTMLAFSLAGGFISLIVMFALKKIMGVIKLSTTGGVVHNIVQAAVAAAISMTPAVFYYIPLLIAAGALSGFAMGVICALVLKRLLGGSLVKGIDLQKNA